MKTIRDKVAYMKASIKSNPELESEFISCLTSIDKNYKKNNSSAIEISMGKYRVYRLCFKHFFDVDINLSRTENQIGVVVLGEDGSEVWLVRLVIDCDNVKTYWY